MGAQFSFEAVDGQRQADALNAAFDQVDRFRVVLKRIPSGEVAADEVISVTPGQGEYDISVDVSLKKPGEVFSAELFASQGETALFEAIPFEVTGSTTGTPAPVMVTLRYTGPGADATQIVLDPMGVALAPGGTTQLTAAVEGSGGNSVSGVPLFWSSGTPAVASVTGAGAVTGSASGLAEIFATSPNGVEGSAWVYVVEGEVAFVRGGHVFVGSILGGGQGEDQTPGAQGASAPAWSPDGSSLFYGEAGSIFKVGQASPVVQGGSVALSSDGSKLAVEVGGTVYFANDDGTLPTPGPTGITPQWYYDGEYLAVGGGSIQRVRADGTGRTVIAGGPGAKLPVLSLPSSSLAYLMDSDGDGVGALWVAGPGGDFSREVIPESLGIRSRPTWSPGEEWVLAEAGDGDGFYLAPAGGEGPAIFLAMSGGASHPAWKPGGSAAPLPNLFLTSIDPETPGPGEEVEILGGGFDWIIPGNNVVFFPSPGGAAEGEVLEIEEDRLLVQVPDVVSAGLLQVVNRSREATIQFSPAPGKLIVAVTKGPDLGVEGVPVFLSSEGSTIATATTDESGMVVFEGLGEGDYEVLITVPEGFSWEGDNPQLVSLVSGSSASAPFDLEPEIRNVILAPEVPSVEVGATLEVEIGLFDIVGDPIDPTGHEISISASSDEVQVTNTGPLAEFTGVFPCSEAQCVELRVNVDNSLHFLTATVTSFITGVILDEVSSPMRYIPVRLYESGTEVAVTETDLSGEFGFYGLFQGSYSLTPTAPNEFVAEPPTEYVTLSRSTPTGTADFLIVPQSVVYTGNLILDSPAAVAAFAAAGYEEVTGSLTITGTTITSLAGMESLLKVGGDLFFEGGLTSLTSLAGLSSLQTVGGWVGGVNVFPGMNAQFPSLVSVGGFYLHQCDLSGVSLPVLATVQDHFELIDNTITGTVVVASDATFTAVNGFWLDGNTGSFTLSVPGLLDPGTNFRLQDNTGLLSVAATTGVASASNVADFDFFSNSNLASISFPNLVQISEMEIYNSPDLQVVDFPRLALSTNSSIHIVGNGTPGTSLVLNFPLLQSVGTNLEIGGAGGDIGALTFNSLTTVPNSLWITNSSGVTSVGLPALTSVGYLEVQNNDDLTSFSAPNLISVGTDILVKNNTALASFDLSAVPSVGDLVVEDNLVLTSFDAGSLASSNQVLVRWNPAITGFDLSALASGGLDLVGANALVSLPALPAFGGLSRLYLDSNPNLTNLAGLTGVTDMGSLVIYASPSLSDLTGLGSLQVVNGVFIVDDADALVTLAVPNLNSAQDIDLGNNLLLESVSFPSLSLVGGFRFYNLPALTSVFAPSLVNLTKDLLVTNTGLASLDGFSTVVSPVASLDVSNNSALADVTGLAGIGDLFADPAVEGSFVISNNSGLCADDVDALIAIIEAKNPGGAFGVAPVNLNNTGVCPIPAPQESTTLESTGSPRWFLNDGRN